MRTRLLGTAGALALAAFAFTGSAEAQCAWNGYNWSCGAPPAYAAPSYPAPYQYPGYASTYYNSYGAPYGYGYNPAWNNAYPGPRASGH